MEIVYKLRSGFSSTARIFSVIFMLLLAASGLQAQNVARIGTTEYATLDEAVAAAVANDVIEIIAATAEISKSAVLPAGATLQGQGKNTTTMTIVSGDGSGITINKAGVTIKDMHIDGSQITSVGYNTLVNVRADNVLIDNVVMTGGGISTWNSSILVEKLPATATFTVSNSTISGSFRGVLRESCSANIVITNCDIDAVYPFNIDGGNGGTVTVTGGALHGWTSYSLVDQVTFTNVEFSKGNSGYDNIAAYVNTTFEECTMDTHFNIYAQTNGFTFNVQNCYRGDDPGDLVLLTNENFTEYFTDPNVWNNCVTIVNEVTLVGSQAQLDGAITAAASTTIDAHTRMTRSFEYDGVLCGPANKYLHLNCCDTFPLIMKNNGDKNVVLTQSGTSYAMRYTCANGSTVALSHAAVAISEGTSFTTNGQTTFFTAAEGYYLIETDNWDNTYTYSVETLADKVARNANTGTYYTSLDDAIDEATPGDTIRLLQDVALTASLTIDKDLTLDLNEKTLSGAINNMLAITAGTVTIKHGEIATTGSVQNTLYVQNAANLNLDTCTLNLSVTTTPAARYGIRHSSTGTFNITGCDITVDKSLICNEGNGTLNVVKSTINGNRYVVHNTAGTVNVTESQITSTAFNSLSNADKMNLVNCNFRHDATATPAILDSAANAVLNIDGGSYTAKTYGAQGFIRCTEGVVNIFGGAEIQAYYRGIEITGYKQPDQYTIIPVNAVVNFGGYMDEHGNLVADGAPTLILRDTTVAPAADANYGVGVYFGGIFNIFGDARITTTNTLMASAVTLLNGGDINVTGGDISAYNNAIFATKWAGDNTPFEENENNVVIKDTASVMATYGERVSINVNHQYPADVQISGGYFSDDVSGEKCVEGYAAFPTSEPNVWLVAPSYTVYYDANQPSGERDTVYVRQADPTHTAKPEDTFTYGTFGFNGWNTKADGTGTDVVPGTMMTLTTDTTLYAQWDYVARIGTTGYGTLAEATAAVPTGTPTTITILKNLNFWDAAGNLSHKTITFTGTLADTLTLTSEAHPQTGANRSDLTFKNITLKNDMIADNFAGIIELNKLTINHCEVLGFMNGYAGTFICDTCTFTKTCKYHLWTYASNSTFNHCVFNSTGVDGKAVNVYWDNTTDPYRVITFNDCEFNSEPVSNGSAIQINSESTCFVVNVNNCTTSGYNNSESCIGSLTDNSDHSHLVNNKTGCTRGRTTLYIDGAQILKQGDCDPVAMIGDTYYATLQSAVDAAHSMTGAVTIELINDAYGRTKVDQDQANLQLTIEGNGHSIYGTIWVDGQGSNWKQDNTLTVTNVNFKHNSECTDCYGSNKGFIYIPSKTEIGDHYNYAHDITIKNCDFDDGGNHNVGCFWMSSQGGTQGNIKLEDITVTSAHSLVQLNSASFRAGSGSDTAIIIKNCIAEGTVKHGINITGGGGKFIITDNKITATAVPGEGYSIRIKQQSGGACVSYLENNEFHSPAEGMIFSGNTAAGDTIYFISGRYDAFIDDSDSPTNFSITGGTWNPSQLDKVIARCAPGYYPYIDEGDTTYTVLKMNMLTFDANVAGATGTMDTLYFDPRTPQTCNPVPDCGFTNPDGVAFLAWNTKADGSGDTYAAGSSMSGINSDTTLYAQWDYVARNVNTNTYYTSLQAAIDAATAGDSLIILADMTIDNPSGNVSITIAKSLTINGNGYDVTCKDARALAITTGNVNVTLRKLNIIAGYEGSGSEDSGVRGFQINNVPNVKLVMDSCRLTGTYGANGKPIPYYALKLVGNGDLDNLDVTVSNSYLWGRAALENYASDSKITFINDTLYGVNVEGLPEGQLEAFATIVLDGNALSANPANRCKRDSVKLINCVVIAERKAYYDEQWIRIQYGAANNDVYADENTKFIDIDATTYEPMSNVYIATDYATMSNEMGTGNSIRMYNLSAGAIDTLRACQHTVAGPDENGVYRVSHSIIYNHNYQSKHSDLDYPFVYGTLSNGDKLYLRENFTMTRNDTADINGNFFLNFKYGTETYSITQDGHHIVLAEGTSCTTDERIPELFTSTTGYVMERGNGNGTFTYSAAIIYNVTSNRGYNDLQTAINTATPGDSLVILTDLTITSTVRVDKSIIINGQKHTIDATNALMGGTTYTGMALVEDDLNVKIRNLNMDGGNHCNRGVHVFGAGDANNCTVEMDSCRLYNLTHYALCVWRAADGETFRVSNSYIQGWSALSCYGANSSFTFYNDTLRGINVQNGGNNDFNVITLNGNSSNTTPQGYNKVDIQKCVIIAEEQGTSAEFWLGFTYGAHHDTVTVDCETKMLDGVDASANNIAEKIYMYEDWESGYPNVGNAIIMPQLTDVQKATLTPYYTLVDATDDCAKTKLSLSTEYSFHDVNDSVMYIDFHYPFVTNHLANGDSIRLMEDVTMTQNVNADINGNFKLKFNSHTLTQGSYSIVLAEGTSATTDAQATSLFTSAVGDVMETDNGNGTYTYSVAPYIALNVNTHTGYSVLQTAVDAVNAGDTIRILRNIELGNGENVNITKTLTLDLNGDTIKIEQFKVDSTYKDWFGALQVKGGDLTIKDSRENGAVIATVPSTAASNKKMGSAVWVTENGNLTLNSGTICGYKFGVYVGTDHAPVNSTATINGGNVTTYGYSGAYSVYNKGTLVTINDGATIIGDTVVYSGYGVFGFSYSSYGQSITTINGGYFRASSVIYNSGGSITIEDGTFISGKSSGSYNLAQNSSNGNITINGGTFYVAKNRGFKNDANATLTFNGGTIVDRGVTYDIIYNKGTVVLNDIELSCHDCDYTIWVDAGGVLETHNGKIENTNTDQSALIYCDAGDAKITIDGTELVGTANNTYGIWEIGPNVDITMTSGSINTTKYCIVNNGTNTTTTSKWVITGGTLQSTESTAIYHAAPDTVIIGVDCTTGPTITGVNAAIEHRAGHLVIKGGTLKATADTYSVTANASGTTTGAAVAVAQHTTAVVTTLDISCGEFEGESSISIANPQGNTTDNVDASITGGTFNGEVVTTDTRIDDYITGGTFDDATVLAELNNRIEPGYTAFANGTTPETWTVAKAYVLIYDANGGTGTMDTVVVQEANKVQTVLPCAFTFGIMPFINWNTAADGTGTTYTPVSSNVTLVNPDTTILYAQWDGVAKIGARSYPTLQAAVDAANASMTGDVTIDLVKNSSEIVTILQKDEISLTINGNDNTLTGQIFIGGRQETPAYIGTHTAPNTVTIDNLNMKYDPAYYNNYGSTDESGLIYFCKNCAFGNVLNYSHNVTISNCDFDADGSNKGVYAISSIADSVYNLNIENCTAKNALGLATLQSAPEFEVINCSTEDVTYGIRIVNNYGPMTVTGNNFTADEAGFYVTGMTTGATINFAEDTVSAPKAFMLDPSCTAGTLDITSGLYIGDLDDNSTTDFFNISGGTYSEDVTGEPCAPGYAAFANGTSPETWTVTKAWFLYYDKNEVAASGTMDTLFVRRDGDDAARTVTVASCEFTWLPYHTFDKWNNKAGGDGNDFAPGDNIVLTSDTTLFAIWKLGYTIMYHNNGGTGFIANQSKDAHVDITLSDGTGFSKEGHTLYRWNTQADGNGTNYVLGATYSEDANLDLYAVWRLNLTMVMDSTDVVCYGEDNGTDTVKIIGGEMPFKLVLSGTEDRTVTNVMTRTYVFENLKPGAYTVTLTDTLNKDIITGTFTIAQPDTLVISSLTVPDAPCPLMGTGTYEVAMTTTGGNGSNVITWGGDATNVDATETTVTPDADDRDRTYTVNVTVTDQKGCVATATADFTVAPVIANDGTTHSNTTMTIADLSYSLLYDCDTVLRNFGTPEFVFTNPAINEDILDTIFNNVPTVAPDSVFAVGNYTIVWTARDTCGHTVTAEQVITITQQPCPSAFDYHGIEYPAVRIGCDCWTTKNLASTQYSDGRQIPDVMHYPINSRASIYGNLYTYAAAMDGATVTGTTPVQGACPEGWHIPSEAESEALMASAEVQDLMSQGLWVPDNGTNASGFNLLPGGCYNAELDRYERMYVSAYFWIAVPASYIYHACEFGAACSSTELVPGNLSNGFSIRCVMDKPTE